MPTNDINNRVRIIRPNLWSGHVGTIVTSYNDGGALVLAESANGHTFHCKVTPAEFEPTLWKHRNDMITKK